MSSIPNPCASYRVGCTGVGRGRGDAGDGGERPSLEGPAYETRTGHVGEIAQWTSNMKS